MSKFTNFIMRKGKKSIATKVIQNTLLEIRNAGQSHEQMLDLALTYAEPKVYFRSKKIAGIKYKIPQPVLRKSFLTYRWFMESCQSKSLSLHKSLAIEILNASKNQGTTVKKKEELHKSAIYNRPNLRYLR